MICEGRDAAASEPVAGCDDDGGIAVRCEGEAGAIGVDFGEHARARAALVAEQRTTFGGRVWSRNVTHR